MNCAACNQNEGNAPESVPDRNGCVTLSGGNYFDSSQCHLVWPFLLPDRAGEYEGLRLVHLGDQGCVLTQEQIDEIGHPDLLMLPVGGYFTIDAAEARQIMDQLQPSVTVPIHYRDGTIGFDVLSTLDEFLALVDIPVVRCEERQFTITEGMPRQVLIPKLVH